MRKFLSSSFGMFKSEKIFISNHKCTAIGRHPQGGLLLGILSGGVLSASPNPDLISDQKMAFPIPIFRPGLKNPYQFSDLTFYVIKYSICISAGRKSM